MRPYTILKSLVLSAFICFPSLAEAAPIAKVIAITQGVQIEREGIIQDLNMSDDLLVNDVVLTNTTGKVQFMFNDDTVVNLSSNTNFTMEEYNDSADDPAFAAQVEEGFARFLTGIIVENDPDAFTITTPDATINVRGTDVAVGRATHIPQLSEHLQAGSLKTAVFYIHSKKNNSVVVNGELLQKGYMAVLQNKKLLESTRKISFETRTQLNHLFDQHFIKPEKNSSSYPINDWRALVSDTKKDPLFLPRPEFENSQRTPLGQIRIQQSSSTMTGAITPSEFLNSFAPITSNTASLNINSFTGTVANVNIEILGTDNLTIFSLLGGSGTISNGQINVGSSPITFLNESDPSIHGFIQNNKIFFTYPDGTILDIGGFSTTLSMP